MWEAWAIQQIKLVEFLSCPMHFVGQAVTCMLKNHIKAYCSMSVSVFINNVEWEVNFEGQGLIICNCNAKKFALLGNLKHTHS